MKNQNLEKYSWHRFFKVTFVVMTLFILWGTFISLSGGESQTYLVCTEVNLSLNRPIDYNCGGILHHWSNFFVALIITIILAYILKFIYYKAIVYIILGKEK